MGQLEGFGTANLLTPLVRQEDKDPAGLTHAESVGVITTRQSLRMGDIVGENRCLAGPMATAVGVGRTLFNSVGVFAMATFFDYYGNYCVVLLLLLYVYGTT